MGPSQLAVAVLRNGINLLARRAHSLTRIGLECRSVEGARAIPGRGNMVRERRLSEIWVWYVRGRLEIGLLQVFLETALSVENITVDIAVLGDASGPFLQSLIKVRL